MGKGTREKEGETSVEGSSERLNATLTESRSAVFNTVPYLHCTAIMFTTKSAQITNQPRPLQCSDQSDCRILSHAGDIKGNRAVLGGQRRLEFDKDI